MHYFSLVRYRLLYLAIIVTVRVHFYLAYAIMYRKKIETSCFEMTARKQCFSQSMYFAPIMAIVSAVFFLLFVTFGPTSPASHAQYSTSTNVASLALLRLSYFPLVRLREYSVSKEGQGPV